MRIEDEINQKVFNSEYQKLAVNIIFTHGWLLSYHKKLFDKFSITPTQYNILRILRGQYPNPVSVNLLKERMLDKMSDTSRLVERLRVKGLVNRRICKKDRRKSDVKITDQGLKLLEELDPEEKKIEQHLNSLNLEEAKKLNMLLDKMRT